MTREEALARVLEQRERGRSRPRARRVVLAGTGLLLLAASGPLLVLLPELGVPALLLALRLLSVEFDWAARAYAAVAWNWARFRGWFHSRSRAVRALVVLATLALAALLLWLLLSH